MLRIFDLKSLWELYSRESKSCIIDRFRHLSLMNVTRGREVSCTKHTGSQGRTWAVRKWKCLHLLRSRVMSTCLLASCKEFAHLHTNVRFFDFEPHLYNHNGLGASPWIRWKWLKAELLWGWLWCGWIDYSITCPFILKGLHVSAFVHKRESPLLRLCIVNDRAL